MIRQSVLSLFCIYVMWTLSGTGYAPLEAYEDLGKCKADAISGTLSAEKEGKSFRFLCLPTGVDPRKS